MNEDLAQKHQAQKHHLLLDCAFNALRNGFEYRSSYAFDSYEEAEQFLTRFRAWRDKLAEAGHHWVEDVTYWRDGRIVAIYHKHFPLQKQGYATRQEWQ